MLKYNTSQPKIILPEYGRHIQKMIDYCVSIPDREERTKCANSIASLLLQITPGSKNEKGRVEKIWDQIVIISDFKLDIDFPVEVTSKDKLKITPKRIPYKKPITHFRQYGKNIPSMLIMASEMENSVEKDNLIFLVANQMKKLLINNNPEIATDIRVFNDIREITKGKISINPENYRLNDYIGVVGNETKKKKRKK